MTASAVPSTAIPKRKVTAAPKMDPIEAMMGYTQNVSWSREERTMTATSTASGRVTIMSESIAAMSPSPHQDDRLLKIPIKNDRIFGYTGFCTKSGLGAVAAVYDRRLCRKLLDGRRYAKRKRDSAQP